MKLSKASIALTIVMATGPAGTLLAQHWGYEGEAGPQNWGKMDAKFAMCASGKNQSPIDLSGFVEADLKPLKLDYKAGIADIL
ncbi:MAG TPA: carbonic anhydrase, partial [Candidatus Binatia bacterium]|nr:carbonic anhydrase [Candidatus Binatia bacterium]